MPFRLTPHEARFLERLTRRAHVCVPTELLHSAVYGNRLDGGPESGALRALIKRLRKRLPPDTIRTWYDSGYSWEGPALPPVDRR